MESMDDVLPDGRSWYEMKDLLLHMLSALHRTLRDDRSRSGVKFIKHCCPGWLINLNLVKTVFKITFKLHKQTLKNGNIWIS